MGIIYYMVNVQQRGFILSLGFKEPGESPSLLLTLNPLIPKLGPAGLKGAKTLSDPV